MSVLSPPPSSIPAGNGRIVTPQWEPWIVFASAAAIAVAVVLPSPWRILLVLPAVTLPGWSVTKLFLGATRLDRATICVLSVAVSMAILIGLGLVLDALGIRIDRRSVPVALAGFEVVIALAMLAWPATADSPASASTDGVRPSLAAVMRRLRTAVLIAVTVGIIGAGVAIVHRLAPTRHDPAFTAIAITGGVPAALLPIGPGPTALTVTVTASSTVTGTVTPYFDGQPVGAPTPVRVVRTDAVRVVATIPPLNGCRHQLSVVFTPAHGSSVKVIRSVVGRTGTCPA